MEIYFFFFVSIVEAHMRANTQRTARGGMRQEGQERGAQNSGEQRHEEIYGRERDGAGTMGYTR